MCMVVAAAILNHPLRFPQENATLAEQDEELVARMRQHEERLKMEQARFEEELSRRPEEEPEETRSEEGSSWYFWSAVSVVLFFAIEVSRSQGGADAAIRPAEDDDVFSEGGSVTAGTMVLDKDALSNFCDDCASASARENWRVRGFVEGFADDLLESLRSVCDRRADMEVGDFVGVGSMFESWKVCKPLMCDLIVPLSPPEPYSFRFHLWCGPSGDMPPDMQGCGRIKVTRERERGCLCGAADLGDDVLCLLHGTDEPLGDEPLCAGNTRFLAKDQVMKWFQISVTKAWARISYKYDFELNFRNLDAAGALKIRFRSGKVVVLNVIPAVRLEDTDAYFVSRFPSDSDGAPDPCWPLSFAVYERNLLKHFSKRLPQNSCHLHCLRIVTFLHRKQTELTGKSGLTNYHVKTALLHLLMTEGASAWSIGSTERRLRDVLGFLQRSLHEKRLHHALIGNRNVPEEVQVPEMFRKAEPVNLFRSLVLQRELYAATVGHFHEMLRNAPVLLREYTSHSSNGAPHHRPDASL